MSTVTAEGCLHGEGTFNSELYNSEIQYKIAPRAKSLIAKTFTGVRAEQKGRRAPPCLFPGVSFSLFSSESTKKESFARRKSLAPRLVRQWRARSLPGSNGGSVAKKKDGAIVPSAALLYTFRRDQFFRSFAVQSRVRRDTFIGSPLLRRNSRNKFDSRVFEYPSSRENLRSLSRAQSCNPENRRGYRRVSSHRTGWKVSRGKTAPSRDFRCAGLRNFYGSSLNCEPVEINRGLSLLRDPASDGKGTLNAATLDETNNTV